MSETTREKQLEQCLAELLTWIYPQTDERRSADFTEEAIRGFRLVGREHPFENVAHIEAKLDAE